MFESNEDVVVDIKTIKALSVDARVDILSELKKKPMTLSEISKALSLAASTVKEHLCKLEEVELIEREETSRKWKYYSLTRKGEQVVGKKKTKFVFMLFSFLIIAVFSGFQFVSKYLDRVFGDVKVASEPIVRSVMDTGMKASTLMVESNVLQETASTAGSSFPTVSILWLSILVVSSVMIGFMIGYFVFKKYLKVEFIPSEESSEKSSKN